MALVRSDAGSNLGLLIVTDELAFTHANVSHFKFVNALNSRPVCDLSVVDNQSSMMRNRSLGLLGIYFTNTTDDIQKKQSGISGIIKSISNGQQVVGTSTYDIKWSAGNIDQLNVLTKAWNGSSVEVLGEIFKERKVEFTNTAKDNVESTDNMWWRFPQDTMWESLDACVEHSYVKDDYAFWAWDDINSKFNVSTFNLEMAQDDKYVFMEAQDANTSTSAGVTHLDSPKITIWSFDKHIKSNELGMNREKLFPNTYIEGNGKGASVTKGCFGKVLGDMGDTSQETIANATDIKDPNTTFGPRKIVRHFPNNTHKFYALSKMYRDYKLATYGKVITIQLYNQMGPPIGSKVTVVTAGNDYKVRGMNLDRVYSDKYIVAGKFYEWNTVGENALGQETPVSEGWVTTVRLISNNVNDGDPDHIAELFKKLKVSN